MAKVVLDIIANTGPLTDVAEGMDNVASSSKKAGEEQKKAFKSGADSAAAANKSVKDLTSNLTIAGINIGQLGAKFSESTKSIGALSKGFGFLKVAIASTGIGAIVIALVSLISYFTKTEKGAEFLERATAGLGAAFDVLVGVLSRVGEFLVQVFSNPKKALSDLANFVKDNLINRFKSFAVILEGIMNLDFKAVSNGFIQLGTGITNATDKAKAFGDSLSATAKKALDAAKAASELTRALQELEDAERSNAITISKNQTEIDKLLVKSKNRSLIEKDRIALLEQAAKLEQSNLNLELEGASKRISIITQENNLKKLNGTLRDEDEDKLKDAIIARDNLERGSLVLQEKIINRKDALLQEIADKQTKINEDKKKSDEDAAKAEQDRIDKLKKAFDEESALNDLAAKREDARLATQLSNNLLTQDQYNIAVNNAKNKALQIQLATIESFNRDGLNLNNERAAKEIEIENSTSEFKIKRDEKIRELETARKDFLISLGDDEFEAKQKRNEKELQELTAKLEEEKALKIAQAEEIGASTEEIETEFIKNKFAINQEFAKRSDDLENQRAEFQKKTQDEKNQQLLSATQSILGDLSVLFEDNFEAQKAFSVASTLISTYESAQKAFNSLAGIPIVGTILGAVAAGIAVAAGLARVNKIREQKPAKQFFVGGYTGDGGKYEDAGDVHKGEFVHTQEKTKKHRNLFEAIHSGDYSKLKLIDLQPLLQGTGVSLNPDVAENINTVHSQISESKSKREGALETQVASMKKDMNKFFKYYKSKPFESTMPDGSKKIVSGNNTRIIRKK